MLPLFLAKQVTCIIRSHIKHIMASGIRGTNILNLGEVHSFHIVLVGSAV